MSVVVHNLMMIDAMLESKEYAKLHSEVSSSADALDRALEAVSVGGYLSSFYIAELPATNSTRHAHEANTSARV